MTCAANARAAEHLIRVGHGQDLLTVPALVFVRVRSGEQVRCGRPRERAGAGVLYRQEPGDRDVTRVPGVFL